MQDHMNRSTTADTVKPQWTDHLPKPKPSPKEKAEVAKK